jgi:hypothetical protein
MSSKIRSFQLEPPLNVNACREMIAEGQERRLVIRFGILGVRHEKEQCVARELQRTAGQSAWDRRSNQARQIEGFVSVKDGPRSRTCHARVGLGAKWQTSSTLCAPHWMFWCQEFPHGHGSVSSLRDVEQASLTYIARPDSRMLGHQHGLSFGVRTHRLQTS